MKKLSLIMSGLALIVTVVSLAGTASAQNTVADPKCETEVYSRSYSVGADTITANFEVKKIKDGIGGCKKEVTVAAWDAPNGTNGAPFELQKFVDAKSGTFAPGYHSLTVKKPTCFYQVDLLRGLSPYGATQGRPDYTAGQYVSSAHGGQECKPAPQPTPVAVTPAAVGGPVQLPKTGPGAVASLALASGTIASVAHNFVARRRNQK